MRWKELISLVADDADALNGLDSLMHLRTIAASGTSADMQLAIFQEAHHRTGNRGED